NGIQEADSSILFSSTKSLGFLPPPRVTIRSFSPFFPHARCSGGGFGFCLLHVLFALDLL
ncbi:MAG: hypothetical protein JXP73_22195, partial [Deltaproteobacteria bacterium]|nr:hypothetical protein [Deltaproteobacteria bacterium]